MRLIVDNLTWFARNQCYKIIENVKGLLLERQNHVHDKLQTTTFMWLNWKVYSIWFQSKEKAVVWLKVCSNPIITQIRFTDPISPLSNHASHNQFNKAGEFINMYLGNSCRTENLDMKWRNSCQLHSLYLNFTIILFPLY